MYKCQLCGGQAQPGVPQHKLVVQVREKFYRTMKGLIKGFETAKELSVCPSCHEEHLNLQPTVVAVKS